MPHYKQPLNGTTHRGKIDIYTSLSTLMLLDKCLFSLYIQGNETGYNNQWKDYCEFIF